MILGLCAACQGSPQVSTSIALSPSAEPYAEAALQAVEWLNRKEGRPVYSLRVVDRAEALDGLAVVYVGTCPHPHDLACTERTTGGVLIRLSSKRITARTLAHEFVHSAGLGHVTDETNLMFPDVRPGWALTAEQLDEIRAGGTGEAAGEEAARGE